MKTQFQKQYLGIFFLMGAILFSSSCENSQDPRPILEPDVSLISTSFHKIGDEGPEIDPSGNRLIADDWSCYKGNRIEFDVYDSSDEFVNPKNYQLSLRQMNGGWKGKKAFSQYCTQNNTVAFYDLAPASYSYTLSSSCTDEVYRGHLLYAGGYYAKILYIDQSLCD